MKVSWVRLCRWLLGVLGISSSISSCILIKAEYGQPTMDFSVKGKAVDSVTGDGVPGIEVSHYHYIDTTGTDGSFSISGDTWPEDALSVELRDIDPEKDGAYKSVETTVALEQTKEGSGHWYKGTYEARDVVLKVEKQ